MRFFHHNINNAGGFFAETPGNEVLFYRVLLTLKTGEDPNNQVSKERKPSKES